MISKRPPNFAAEAHLPNKVLMPRYGVDKTQLHRWRKSVGVKLKGGGGHKCLEIPADFAERAGRESDLTLAAHYGRSPITIRNWRHQLGIAAWRRPRKQRPPGGKPLIPAPDDLREVAARLHISALVAHYGRDRKTVMRWLTEGDIEPVRYGKPKKQPEAIAPQPFRRTPTRGTVFLAQAVNHTPLKSGREEEAAQHLRRFYLGVFRSNEAGAANPKGKFWRCGAVVLTGAELIARAERKGFDPLAWQRLPEPSRSKAGGVGRGW